MFIVAEVYMVEVHIKNLHVFVHAYLNGVRQMRWVGVGDSVVARPSELQIHLDLRGLYIMENGIHTQTFMFKGMAVSQLYHYLQRCDGKASYI